MSERLPVHVDPVSLAEKGRAIDGYVPVEAFRRLAGWLHASEGVLDVSLRFGRDEAGRDVVAGRIRGELELLCQRCLAPYRLPVDVELGLVLVASEAAANLLPDELDALVVDAQRSMHTVDMIEDDLILALPLVPRCERVGDCVPAVELLDSEAIEAAAGQQRPFTDLDA